MTTWDDIQTAINNFWNWLTSTTGKVTAGFTDTLGELGSWIFGGLKWLADQFYNAITWLADKIKEAWQWFSDRLHDAYVTLSKWIAGGLQWISSGLSWIGQHLYSLGQWLWNGLCWIADTVRHIVESIANWIWKQLMNIYNTIVGQIVNWIRGINDYLNDWFKSLREKLIQLLSVNFTFLGIEKAINLLGKGKFKHGLGLLIGSPFIGIAIGYVVDAIIPRPASQRIIFFPEFNDISITPETVFIPSPEEKPIPEESPKSLIVTPPPAIGYRPNVETNNSESETVKIVVTLGNILGANEYESENVVISKSVPKTITISEFESETYTLSAGGVSNLSTQNNETVTKADSNLYYLDVYIYNSNVGNYIVSGEVYIPEASPQYNVSVSENESESSYAGKIQPTNINVSENESESASL